MGDKWPLQHRHVLGQAIRIRSPYVDALSVTQVLALRSLRVLLQCLFDRFGSVFPQCGLMVFPGVVIVSR